MPQPPKTSRDDVVRAALVLLEHGGADAVTLRAVARELAVAPSALYWHIDDRDGLLRLLAERGAVELADRLRSAVPPGAGSLADLTPVASAYLAFARDRPHLYRLITAPGRDPAAGRLIWDRTLALLGTVVEAERAAAVGMALWAYLHGAAGVEALGPFDHKPADAVLDGLDALIAGLTAGG